MSFEKIKLFCFPYAGGSSVVYNKWRGNLDSKIELIPVEMAGRGKRFRDKFYTDMHEAVDDLFLKIKDQIVDGKYGFFGHSMGSAIAFELIKKIIKNNLPEPSHVFFSGRRPPHVVKKERILNALPLNEFKEEILKIGGTPKELFENKELLDIFMPILRADYKLIEEYRYIEDDMKLDIDVTALYGTKDDGTSKEIMLRWNELSSGEFNLFDFNGGHFFINDETQRITQILNTTLLG